MVTKASIAINQLLTGVKQRNEEIEKKQKKEELIKNATQAIDGLIALNN